MPNNIILTIKEMHELAHLKGGNCLSTNYINNQTKLKWKCSKGHVWEATPDSVKNQNTWCPFPRCYRNRVDHK